MENVTESFVLLKQQGSIKVWSSQHMFVYNGVIKGHFCGPHTNSCFGQAGKEFGLHKSTQTDCIHMEQIQVYCYPPQV